MVAEPLFTPEVFVRNDEEEIHYLGGSLVLYGLNGVGKSYLLEAIASSLLGEVVGRAEAGSAIPEEEALLGVIARLSDAMNPEEIQLLQPPPGQYPYDEVDELRQAVEATRAREGIAPGDSEEGAGVNELLDEFASLRHVFLVPVETADSVLGRGWRLHAVARGLGLKVRGLEHAPIGRDDVWEFVEPGSSGQVTAYRYNGYKPYLYEGTVPGQTVFGRVIDDSRIDIDEVTRAWLTDRSSSRLVDGVQVEGETLDSIRELADAWAVRANQLLRTFLADPPELSFRFGDPAAWLVGDSPGWLGIDGLSFAERRWAQVAIALAAEPDDTSYLIVDEPERGLHRAAEAHLAEGLRTLVAGGQLRMIAATHSPEFIDTDFGQLFRLEPGESTRWGSPRELTRDQVDELRSIGLQPTSLLSRDRGYLLVEGEHDKQIFEEYFGAELKEMRVKVLSMRGAKNVVNIFDSEFLVHATDALLMPPLDDIAMDPLKDLWAAAVAATIEGRRSDAVGVIKRGLDRIPGRGKDAYEPLLIGTITRGEDLQRFYPLGMSKKDVLEYLPVAQLVDGAISWEELREQWNRSPASMADRSGKAYKTWLRRVKRADLSPENLRLVAETTGGAPRELKEVIASVSWRLDQIASRTP